MNKYLYLIVFRTKRHKCFVLFLNIPISQNIIYTFICDIK